MDCQQRVECCHKDSLKRPFGLSIRINVRFQLHCRH